MVEALVERDGTLIVGRSRSTGFGAMCPRGGRLLISLASPLCSCGADLEGLKELDLCRRFPESAASSDGGACPQPSSVIILQASKYIHRGEPSKHLGLSTR